MREADVIPTHLFMQISILTPSKTKVDKIPPLTSDQLELLKKTVAEVEQDHRLERNKRYIEKFRIPIGTSDLFRVRPGLWLNDEVINFYMNMIVDRSKKEHPNEPQKILVHNTFFFPQLSKGGYKSVSRWAKRLGVFGEDLLKLDYMFVPVHVSKTHWCLAVANFKLKRFEYYDSLGGNFSPDSMPGLYTVCLPPRHSLYETALTYYRGYENMSRMRLAKVSPTGPTSAWQVPHNNRTAATVVCSLLKRPRPLRGGERCRSRHLICR